MVGGLSSGDVGPRFERTNQITLNALGGQHHFRGPTAGAFVAESVATESWHCLGRSAFAVEARYAWIWSKGWSAKGWRWS